MRCRVLELAVLGAAPAFAEPLHVGRPNLVDRAGFQARVDAMLERRWFTNGGPLVTELEESLASYLAVPHCVALSSGTAALCLMLRSMGLRGGQVLLPSFTFVASAHALAWEGLEPGFCDVDPESWTLDAEACEAAITPSTRAILGVHLFGRPCEVARLEAVAVRHGLALVFDAAHAFGCTAGGRLVGGFGRAEAFSFHATKAFHTFEGGAVATRDAGLASEVRGLRNFGFRGTDDVGGLGINAKMPEICAAMGLANLAGFAAVVDGNRERYEVYREALAGLPGIRLREVDQAERQNYHYVVVEVEEGRAGLGRDELVRVLEAENVLARRYFFPGAHAMEPYRTQYPDAASRLARTRDALDRVMVLPAGNGVEPAQVERVAGILEAALGRAEKVRRALGDRRHG